MRWDQLAATASNNNGPWATARKSVKTPSHCRLHKGKHLSQQIIDP